MFMKNLRNNLIAFILTLIVFITQAWFVWDSYDYMKTTERQFFLNTILAGRINHLDEALTMSARMASATGDLTWETRYREYEKSLDSVLSNILISASRFGLGSYVRQTVEANDALVEMENRSFDLVRIGKTDSGTWILNSKEYERQKEVYENGHMMITRSVSEMLENRISRQYQHSVFALIFLLTATPVLVAAWILTLRRERRITLEKATRERELFDREARYRALFSNSLIGMYETSPDGRILEVNQALCEMLGFSSAAEVKNLNLEQKWYAGYSRDLFLDKIRSDGLVNSMESEWHRKDGSEIIVSENARGVFDQEGNLRSIQGTVEDITEKVNARKETLRMNQELAELNRSKDKFFSIIAHDLRNPFLGLLGLSEILADESAELPMSRVRLISKNLHGSLRQVNALLQNLLEWSRLQQGRMAFRPVSLNVTQLIREAAAQLMVNVSRKNIQLELRVGDHLPVMADQAMLSSVLLNLISNAVKFTPVHGHIFVEALRSNEWIEIMIRDTGVGIEKERLETLFHIDNVGSTHGTEGETGSGLGLVLCKEFTEKNSGTLKLISQPGKGTTVILKFPVVQV